MSMLKRFLSTVCILLGCIVFTSPSRAQPTGNLMARVLMVENQNLNPVERATIFSIDVDQREYWITAKHLLTGAKHPPFGSVVDKTVVLRILNPGIQEQQWLTVNFKVIDTGEAIDIVVLAPPEPLLPKAVANVNATDDGVMLGGNCEFLGYAFGGAWQAPFANGTKAWMPFIKHCTISASVESPHMWILDGINNYGFSGGPVFYGTGPTLEVIGVISGFHTEPLDVIPNEPAVKPTKPMPTPGATVNVNAGFFTAYSIEYATDAIKKNPIGPIFSVK